MAIDVFKYFGGIGEVRRKFAAKIETATHAEPWIALDVLIDKIKSNPRLINFHNMSEFMGPLQIKLEDGFSNFEIPDEDVPELQEMAKEAGMGRITGVMSEAAGSLVDINPPLTEKQRLKIFVLLYAFQAL